MTSIGQEIKLIEDGGLEVLGDALGTMVFGGKCNLKKKRVGNAQRFQGAYGTLRICPGCPKLV